MSGSPQAALIWGWRGAASGVVHRLKQLLETGERSDVQFAVGREHGDEQLFRAHKLVLSSGSDVFDGMFYGEVSETPDKTIELPDILPQAFAVMLKFLYMDVVEDLSVENVLSTLYCAQKYGIPKLFDISAEYAAKNVDKYMCLVMLEAAKVLDAEKLMSKCLEIIDEHCTELLQSEGFLRLKNETLREIFSRDTLIVNEDEVHKAAQRWAINVCRSRGLEPTTANYRIVLGEALFAVRFPLIDDEVLASFTRATGLLLDDEFIRIYQFKYISNNLDIPFSVVPRRPDIAFCDRQWRIVEQSDVNSWMTTRGNVLLDEHGHLHLRISQHDGVWKGAEVRLIGALPFGRYEFHIEGVARLEPLGFVFAQKAATVPEFCISFLEVPVPGENGQNSTEELTVFVVRPPTSIADASVVTAPFDKTSEGPGQARLTHSFHWKPESVSFSCQRGHQHNNTAEELCTWAYDAQPSIRATALPLSIHLLPLGNAPSEQKEVIVHSFHFYPDE